MTIGEIKKVLDEVGCCYEIIKQDKPILSVTDAESFYPVEKAAPTFILQTGYRPGCIPLVGLGIPCIFDKKLLCHDFVYGETGDELLTLKINPKDLIMVNEIKGMFE